MGLRALSNKLLHSIHESKSVILGKSSKNSYISDQMFSELPAQKIRNRRLNSVALLDHHTYPLRSVQFSSVPPPNTTRGHPSD